MPGRIPAVNGVGESRTIEVTQRGDQLVVTIRRRPDDTVATRLILTQEAANYLVDDLSN
jgi:hypothetical protein